MNKIVRWGILGAGKIAHSFAKDIVAVQNASLVAVAARDVERAEEFALQYAIPHALDYEGLYTSNEVDAVYIATTHNFHFEQCIKCIQHGKHVLCEKPITLNDAQFNAIARLATEKNVFVMEAMWTWFLPAIIKAKQWMQEGRIGELKVIEANFGFPMEKNLTGRLYNINLAGGALLDLGVYPVAFSSFMMDELPGSIIASGQLTSTGVDERTGIILQYKNVSATLFTSLANIMSNKAMLYGESGYIEIPDFFKASTVRLYDSFHTLVDEFTDYRTTKGYNFEIQHASDCIGAGTLQSDVVTHEKSKLVQEIMTHVRRQIGLEYPGENDF